MILEEAKDSVSSLHLHGKDILAGSIDGHVRVYDIRMGRLRTDNIQHPVTSVRFTEDCQAILVTSLDSTIRLIDSASGLLLNSYIGHTNKKYRISSTFLQDDALVAGGS